MRIGLVAKMEIPGILCDEGDSMEHDWESDLLYGAAKKIQQTPVGSIGFTFNELAIMDRVLSAYTEVYDEANHVDRCIATFGRDVYRALQACCIPGTWDPKPRYAQEKV
jgi:hypothetical protein